MTNKDVLKKINEVGENFGWQIGKVPTNYINGYMQAIRDCKAPFYKEHIVEANEMVVTNGDLIRKEVPNMTDEDFAKVFGRCFVEGICRHSDCEECVKIWLKEKVE